MSKDNNKDPITVDVGNVYITDTTSTGWDPVWDELIVDTTLDIDINHHYSHTIDPTLTTTTVSTIADVTFEDINFTLNPKEFVDYMPGVEKIESMCKEYPALKEAWENFRTMYEMVHQDWLDNSDDAPPF